MPEGFAGGVPRRPSGPNTNPSNDLGGLKRAWFKCELSILWDIISVFRGRLDVLLQSLSDQLHDLAGFRVAPQLRLLEDRPLIHNHLEATAPRWDQFDRRLGVTFPKLSRQTGGSGLVVSIRAVLDGDGHRSSRGNGRSI